MNISSLELSLLRKYVSGTLDEKETADLNAFLAAHPEYNEVLEGLTLADLEKIEEVSAHSSARVQHKVTGKKWKGYGWVAAAVGVLILGSVWYQSGKEHDFTNTALAENDSTDAQQDLVAIDTSTVTPALYHKEITQDTFYYINTDEVVPELAIEYIEENEKDKEQPTEIKEKNLANQEVITQADTLPQSVTFVPKPDQPKKHSFEFVASLDYRQSVEVESNYASAYKVGQTKSFAGPIGGYEYDPKGMPQYGSSEEDFYQYIEQALQADTLLRKISKPMEAKVSFEVDHKGRVENVSVVKCNHKQLCLKLSDIFEQFPDWQPADFKGKKGSVHYVIQVIYE